MNNTTKQVTSIAFAFMLIVSVFSVVQLGSAATGDPTSFTVTQAGECWEVSTRGDGTQNVSEYYDYRNPFNSDQNGNFTYSSWGTQSLQENQVSQLFLYNGSEGVSLVIIHDKLDQDGEDAPYGSTITFNITGLPSDGEWAVEDDDYPNQDDNWTKSPTSADIDWMWQSHRTDGGAYTGLESSEFTALTINPGFNEDADEWGEWDYSGDANNSTDAWKFVHANGSKQNLDMNESLTIAQGTCEPDTPTETETTTETETETTTETTTETETETTTETETETETTTETETETVTETETETKTETETETETTKEPPKTTEKPPKTTEEPDDPPTVNLIVKNEAPAGQNNHVYAQASDDHGIVEYYWFIEGKDNYGKADKANIYPTYWKPGKYTIRVRVTDTSGQTATDTVTLHVKDKTKPTAKVHVPKIVTVGESFPVKATKISEPLSHICWLFDGKEGANAKTDTYTFDKPGTYTVTLKLKDKAGNVKHIKRTIKVKPAPSTGDDSKKKDDSSSEPDAYQPSDDNDESSDDDDSSSDAYQGSDEPTGEAIFEILDLEVDTDRIVAGDTVKLTATISNAGTADGAFTGNLLMGETVLTSETVDVAAGETKTVTFTYTFDEAGEYALTVDGLTKTFEVHEPATEATVQNTEEAVQNQQTSETESTDGPGQPGFGVFAALLALLSAALLAIRRR